MDLAGLRKDLSNYEMLLILNPSFSAFHFPAYLPMCQWAICSLKIRWLQAGGNHAQNDVYFVTEGKWQHRVIYLVSSWGYELNGSFKFLTRPAVKNLQAFLCQGIRWQSGFWLVFRKAPSRADVSMCAVLKNLTSCSWKKCTVCQRQFIFYLYIQYEVSPSNVAPLQVKVRFHFCTTVTLKSSEKDINIKSIKSNI